MTAKDELTTTYKRLVKYLGVFVQSKNIGGHSDPPGETRVNSIPITSFTLKVQEK